MYLGLHILILYMRKLSHIFYVKAETRGLKLAFGSKFIGSMFYIRDYSISGRINAHVPKILVLYKGLFYPRAVLLEGVGCMSNELSSNILLFYVRPFERYY